jgi:cyanophycinase
MAQTRLLVEGGGDDLPTAGLARFCSWARDRQPSNSYVLVVPWASSRTHEEILADYGSPRWFGGHINVILAPSAAEIAADQTNWAGFRDLVSSSGGVFIGGGDQNLIVDLFEATPNLREFLQSEYRSGLPFGGTSAGASIMSETMLTGEGGAGAFIDDEEKVLWNFITPGRVGVRRGLGLTPDIVIDQHFVLRQRNNRLLSVLSTPGVTEKFGIGIDEDVAVSIIDGHKLEVFGNVDRVAVLFERIQDSRVKFITTILRASPEDAPSINLRENY